MESDPSSRAGSSPNLGVGASLTDLLSGSRRGSRAVEDLPPDYTLSLFHSHSTSRRHSNRALHGAEEDRLLKVRYGAACGSVLASSAIILDGE